MKKSGLKLSLVAVMAVLALGAAGCEEKHTHEYTTLRYDATSHWYECTCGEKDESSIANHAGGTATCLEKAVCDICKTEYGEKDANHHADSQYTYEANEDGTTHTKKHWCCNTVENAAENHEYTGWDTSDASYDYKKCGDCNAVNKDDSNAFKKTVTNTDQKLLMTAETVSVDLSGVSEYASVKSIKLGEELVYLGTDLTAIDFQEIKTDTKKHGKQTLTVVVTDEGGADHTISVPVILVTKSISTADELKETLFDGAQSQAFVYGYYTIANDIDYTSAKMTQAQFFGTFDGEGHTIITKNLLKGLFGEIYGGATVKDLTIKATISQNADNVYVTALAGCVFAGYKDDAGKITQIENLTVVYEGGQDSANIYGGGLIARGSLTDVTFRNLVVKAAGKKIGSLFGTTMQNATFDNCVVTAEEVNAVAAKKDNTGRVELADVTGINFILGSQKVLVTAATKSIDLKGADNGRVITAIKCGNVSLGTNPAALEIPDSFKNDAKQHGGRAVTIEFADGTDLQVGVIFITAEISTDEELKALLHNANTTTVSLYGYYVMSEDIVYTGTRNYVDLYGTFDGNGKTITTNNIANGLFTYVKNGATIKNLTFNATSSMPGYGCVLSSGIEGAAIENVIVNYVGGTDSDKIQDYRGFLTRESAKNTTFKNLVVNASGKKIGSLFGSVFSGNTFIGCSVTAQTIACVASSGNEASVTTDQVKGITFTIG